MEGSFLSFKVNPAIAIKLKSQGLFVKKYKTTNIQKLIYPLLIFYKNHINFLFYFETLNKLILISSFTNSIDTWHLICCSACP